MTLFLIMLFIINLLLTLQNCPKLPGCTQCNDEQTHCYSCNTDLHYNYRPDGNGKCTCNNDELYYDYGDSCQKVSSENCGTGCSYCFVGATYRCAECNTTNFFVMGHGSCYCDSEEHFVLGKGEDANKCVCNEGYILYKNRRCTEIEYGCSSGCESCYGYDRTCIECKDKFIKIPSKSNHSCFCQEGYVLDEYKYSSGDRCLDAFPTTCPEGCTCDAKNKCIGCKSNYITVYYDDNVTIKSCNQTFDCPQEISGTCSKCDKDGNCITCQQGYIYSHKNSKCILRDESIQCNENGCLQCSQSNSRVCEACPAGYYAGFLPESEELYCTLKTVEPIKILYLELTDSNVISKLEDGKVNINLKNIQDQKKRPYYYSVDTDDSNIIINNDDNLDFQFRLPYSNNGSLIIANADGSNKNPPYNIKLQGKYDLNCQTSQLSLEGKGEATLITEQDKLEIKKITIVDSGIIINHDVDVNIEEVNIHHKVDSNNLEFIPKDSRNNLKVSVNTLKLHQNSRVKVSEINVDTLIASSKSTVIAKSITVQNLEINELRTAIDGYATRVLEGNISGIPKSIKLNVNHDIPSLYNGQIYIPHSSDIAYGTNEEFIKNCEKWAEVYNSNPTDEIYNYASCNIYEDSAYLRIGHKNKDNGNGGGSSTGIIIGVVVACVVVVALVVFLLVYFLVIRKRKQNKDNSSTQQDAEQPQNEE